MKYGKQRRSSNIEDRRGKSGGMPRLGGGRSSFGGGRSGGTGGAIFQILFGLFWKMPWWLKIVVVGIGVFLFVTPVGREVIGQGMGVIIGANHGSPTSQNISSGPSNSTPAAGQMADRMSAVLGSTEDIWRAQYPTAFDQQYRPTTLVLYDSRTQTGGCGTGSASAGPFYCPADQKVYIDLSFFEQLAGRLGAKGDFAQAYVLAHEVGHHIQTLTGVSSQNQRERQILTRSGDRARANQLSVKQELQADCYAGVWAHHANIAKNIELEAGDVEEAMNAAKAVGDDTLQKASGRRIIKESFTHGSSAQRMKWFDLGFDRGDPLACDTFNE